MFSSRLRRPIGSVSIWLLALQIGCRTWVEHPVPSDTTPVSAISGVVRVTMTQGKTTTLRDAIVARDSIVGLFSIFPTYRVAIPLADVARIEQRVDTTPRWARIALKAYGALALAGIVALGVIAIQLDVARRRCHCD